MTDETKNEVMASDSKGADVADVAPIQEVAYND